MIYYEFTTPKQCSLTASIVSKTLRCTGQYFSAPQAQELEVYLTEFAALLVILQFTIAVWKM